MAELILEMKDITKNFTGVRALDKVCLSVVNHEIHALVGENGAGKSTLMKVLSGVYPHGSYDGHIFFKGKECQFRDIRDSEAIGIVIIHQELALIPYLSIAENIFLGNEQAKNGVINWDETVAKAKKLLQKVGLDENPNTLIADIGVGKQQLVEIAKALAKDVKLLILDEPTAALNDEESNKLLDLLVELKSHGITSILISHKLNEITKVADSVTVIRDGRVIETLQNENHVLDEDRIIKSMVGREIVDRFPKRSIEIGEEIFRVEGLSVYDPLNEDRQIIKNVSFTLRKGEVVGFAGLMGAGRTEIAMSVFGKSYGIHHRGKIYKNGKELHINSVPEAIDNGIAYVTEDRKNYGLVLIGDIRSNVSLASLRTVSRLTVIDENCETRIANEYRDKLKIKCASLSQRVENLSGGNQQKVVLGKWIMANPDVLILDEPTRGIDVGAKYEIYTIINKLASEGKAILMISSEMPELLGMCDRIYVITEGEVVGELRKHEASQEAIMKKIIEHQKKSRQRVPA
ncbi:multiple monosaccharide ABC transporter ATP-binding protein [Gracilinema caldarium]|uniref:multiple monosaccharide ABC transporter ATP-binding protein n=1 Tax=Gracilinema caldarium TaxID=215591 RepID=UPI0026EE36D5|nr:multiple monosaccharide ABC transporter ATP-binding protein [Gracilinema caldarium]